MFIHYFLELPMGWSLASDESGENQGLTQTCYIRSDKEVAHFGHPFCLDPKNYKKDLDKDDDKTSYFSCHEFNRFKSIYDLL